jgi:hypothetical protein
VVAMARRNAFNLLRTTEPISLAVENLPPVSNLQSSQPLDLIPVAEFKRKRSRKWELDHRAETVTYRGISQQIVNLVMEISESLSVPRDEVVRAFLEYSLNEHRNGKFPLYAHPKAQRMTLFPEHDQSYPGQASPKSESKNWLADAFPVPEKGAGKKKKGKSIQEVQPQWKLRVTFRIPVSLKENIRGIAYENFLPVGEIVCFFILHGSKAFQAGNLVLHPTPRAIGRTLFGD